MKALKLIIRIILSPFMLLITLMRITASFLVRTASWILGIISLAVLAVSVFWFATEGTKEGMTALVFAVLLSPIGLPMIAQLLIESTKAIQTFIRRIYQ